MTKNFINGYVLKADFPGHFGTDIEFNVPFMLTH